jgi:hypothetical protein
VENAFYVLVAVGGIIALWLMIRFIGGCLWRVVLGLAVLALVATVIFSLNAC